MTIEFIIACNTTTESNIRQILTELLTGILVDKQNDFNAGILADMVRIRHQRPVTGGQHDAGATGNPTLIGFAVELPDDTRDAEDVISDFANALPGTPPISHVVKFEDPLLEAYLAERSREIFALEMKLRRVLSFVYLNAYQLEDPFNLLREEITQPTRPPRVSDMQEVTENQFFHLLFSQYISLNQRRQPNLQDLLSTLHSSTNYDRFRARMARPLPVEDVGDSSFLASLKEILEPIESMRNCVAHNRRPSSRIIDNYHNVLNQVDSKLNEYLARWETQE